MHLASGAFVCLFLFTLHCFFASVCGTSVIVEICEGRGNGTCDTLFLISINTTSEFSEPVWGSAAVPLVGGGSLPPLVWKYRTVGARVVFFGPDAKKLFELSTNLSSLNLRNSLFSSSSRFYSASLLVVGTDFLPKFYSLNEKECIIGIDSVLRIDGSEVSPKKLTFLLTVTFLLSSVFWALLFVWIFVARAKQNFSKE